MTALTEELDRRGVVIRTFGERSDSRTTLVGLEAPNGDRVVVKHAVDAQAVGWLENALRFHAVVHHPVIVPVIDSFRTDDGGLGIVMPWAPGGAIEDSYDAAVPGRDEPGSPYQRFAQQTPDRIAAAVAQIIDAHVAVADAGFVAVDLYNGCLLYDFDAARVSLIDLDMYRPGPYVLDFDRQYGSSSLMPPEEFERGATIDQRATVFTLGRIPSPTWAARARVVPSGPRSAAPRSSGKQRPRQPAPTQRSATRLLPPSRRLGRIGSRRLCPRHGRGHSAPLRCNQPAPRS